MVESANDFLRYLTRERKYSPHTIAAYRNDLTQMMDFVAAEQARGIIKESDELLRSYLLSLREKKYAPATMARKIAAAKSFFKFMVDSGRLEGNPTHNLVSPQVARYRPKILSHDEVHRLLEEPTKSATPEAKRDSVMLELLYATGLRVSELVSLDMADINLEQCYVDCCHGNFTRKVPFDHHMSQLLRNFIRNDRLDLLFNEKEPTLFLNRRGSRMTRQGFWQIFKNYAARAGLSTKVTPQSLRHSFAAHKLQAGARLEEVQQLLGHEYISSTRIYQRG